MTKKEEEESCRASFVALFSSYIHTHHQILTFLSFMLQIQPISS
jgi:hypothetical protein